MMRGTSVQSRGRILRQRINWISFVSVLSVGLGTLASLNAQSLTWLGALGGTQSEAFGVSADGTVVVGTYLSASGVFRAFRWTLEEGMQDLGTLPDDATSAAYGVSADGTVVVGEAQNASGEYRAFRWVQGQGMQDLGTLGGDYSDAFGVSSDGRVVVGYSENASNQYRAFRWTLEEGMQDLGTLPDYESSEAYGVSADGTVVVGRAYYSGYSRAFRWVQGQGMEDLNSLLPEVYVLEIARAISPDGRYIVGAGYNPHASLYEAFLLDTWRTGDTNGDGCIDDADLLAVLFAFGSPGTGYTRHEDINKDGVVDDADLLTVLFEFGSGC